MSLLPKVIPYRDVTPEEQLFGLEVRDCWAGLHQARLLSWVSFSPGAFNLEEFLDLENPYNADIHEVVPNKFFAMRGPVNLPCGVEFQDVRSLDTGAFSHRDFSPHYYARILQLLNVQLVVRLNAPCYDKVHFERAGIVVVDLFFEDCTSPGLDVVAKFLDIVEGIHGAVAVHCKAGLGRTGTVIGLSLMKHFDFSARAAMGWLRILRPGSVMGEQQGFLCAREKIMRRDGEEFRARGGAPTRMPESSHPAHIARFVEKACKDADRRVAVAIHRAALAYQVDVAVVAAAVRVQLRADS